MTTEDLMKLADKFAFFMPGSEEGEKARQALLDALQSQAERIKVLDGLYENATASHEDTMRRAMNAEAERDQARAELAAIRAQEPVAWNHGCNALCADIDLWIDHCPHCGKPRPAAPAPQEKDAARLDWYEANATHVISVVDTWYSRAGYLLPMTKRKSLRAAIDAAMGITG